MPGFILGTGSGVLAAAAIYYTLSTHLKTNTTTLRSEIRSSANLLNISFDPSIPPAAAALIGPSSAFSSPPFSLILRQRWNDTLSSLVDSVRGTDWGTIGKEIVEVSKSVVDRLGETGAIQKTEKTVNNVVDAVKENASGFVKPATNLGDLEQAVTDVKTSLEDIDLHKDKVGTVGGVQEQLRKKVQEAKGRMV
ncbi:uncharacterized protein L203_102486 [Cryptococcus depauperatus CBS 7841]|uniref:Uncharacterized protein n=1 Tax=Cryptococcus depauperatus CBS 7841 TaxID=1295531 RepID=A0A1E3HF89_9TREE|nr:hypothetical protein L203_06545 [Cryptococcus depauperatus CBS 7841]